MDERLAHAIGARVRSVRAANRQTRVVVAGLTGITADYLYQIERGKKLPTIPVLTQLADVLKVPVSQLLAEESADTERHEPQPDRGTALYRALTQPSIPRDPLPVPDLHRQVRAAWRTWQTSPHRYTELFDQLPALVADVRAQEQRQHDGAGRRAVLDCATDLYGLLRTAAKRVGRLDLSMLVADRALRAAEAADDPHRLAAAHWNVAHVLLAYHDDAGAEAVTMRAAEALAARVASDDIEALALQGALRLLGAVAAVRQGEVWCARERVRNVAALAKRTGECNAYWTAFGPTNVAMYAVSVELEAGEASEGLRQAERIDPLRSPSIERRVAFFIEQAKGHAQRQDFGSTLALLHATAREAPEDVAQRPAARRLLGTVIQRGRRGVSAEAALLAQRVGLPLT